MKYCLLLIACAAALVGCTSTPDTAPIRTPEELYDEAQLSLETGNYRRADEQLRRLLARYPFTDFAIQAHLNLLFVYLQLDDPESLIEEADRFIRENPRHPQIEYVYYMRGLGYYDNTRSVTADFLGIDVARRDISNAEQSFQYFSQLANRYPDSPYTSDARLRMIELKQRIARHEIHIAEYYLRTGAWVAAAQRARRVLADLQGTPAEIDALLVLERAYSELGLEELAATSRRILDANSAREPVIIERD